MCKSILQGNLRLRRLIPNIEYASLCTVRLIKLQNISASNHLKCGECARASRAVEEYHYPLG